MLTTAPVHNDTVESWHNMDDEVVWKVSPKVETLVDALAECKKLLVERVKSRYPYNCNIKIRYCDAYASPKLCELLNVCKPWKDYEETKEDFLLRHFDMRPRSQNMVADFELFKLIKDTIIGDCDIRLVMEFTTGTGGWEKYYGNVKLVTK
jgi:hypothetical protein